VALANVTAFPIDQVSTGADLAMNFLAGVLISGLVWGLRPALTAAALAILTYNFFILELRFSLQIGHPGDVLTFAIFFAWAAATGWLTGRVRDQARLSVQRAAAVTALLAASRRLSAASTQNETAQALAGLVLPPHESEMVQTACAPATEILTAGAMAAAHWAWEKGEAAGSANDTLP
jgi:two-component system sensor histidine kinase KdpD